LTRQCRKRGNHEVTDSAGGCSHNVHNVDTQLRDNWGQLESGQLESGLESDVKEMGWFGCAHAHVPPIPFGRVGVWVRVRVRERGHPLF
jgi:hypothetical protein